MLRVHHYLTEKGDCTIATGSGNSLLLATGLPMAVQITREQAAQLIRRLDREATRVRPLRDDD